jgi:hypothetical protein
MRYDVGDILKSNVLEEIVIVLTNNHYMYMTLSKRFKSIKEYQLTQTWYKLNA